MENNMAVRLNGEPAQLQKGTTIAGLVAPMVQSAGVAIALNGEVIARSLWPETQLSTGDQIEIIQAVQGG